MGAPNRILLSCLAIAISAGGCASTGTQLASISGTDDFQTTVLDSQKPAVVLFYKEGCPACAMAESTLSRLSAEYSGRVVFAECPVMTPFFTTLNDRLRKEYLVRTFPTVILFVGGEARQRWEATRGAAEYRQGIDEALGNANTKSAATSK